MSLRHSKELTGQRQESRVRIVGGRWKRTPLAVLAVDGLRPTPDRVRETLFNWLGQDLTGWRCLDLFAGTGALGLEAASRGAAHVTLVERDPRLVRALRQVQGRLDATGVEVVQADAMQWIGTPQPVPWDLILLDPPFRLGLIERLLPLLPGLLADQGCIYVECERRLEAAYLEAAGAGGLSVIRADRAGQVHYHLLATSGT